MKVDDPRVALAAAIRFDPFAGDFGEPGDRTFRDKIVKARKEGECANCTEPVKPGQFVRSRVEYFEGRMESYRWCQTCTELQSSIVSKDDSDEEEAAYEARCKTNHP